MPSPTAIIFPSALSAGDTIGVIATGSPLDSERYQAGVRAIEQRGYRVEAPLDPSRDYGKYDNNWSNGSVEERLEALSCLLKEPKVKAIIAARGGYGTSHLLPYIEPELLRSNPKPLLGLSDLTPLLAFQAFHAGVVAIHGSSVGASLADSFEKDEARADTDELFEILSNPDHRAVHSCQVLRDSSGEGQLLVGNLSMLVGMLGTPWDIDYSGKILVLEDVGEAPFKIHRLLSQLAFAGKFNGLAGLVFGRFSKCDSSQGPGCEDVFSIVLNDILSTHTFPVYTGLALGHWGRNVPLGLGCRAELSEGSLRILEAAVA